MKTVKIAICDDEKTMRETLRRKIEVHCKNTGVICQISDFDSGDRLLNLAVQEVHDILFLDIQMPGKSGMQTARELRHKNQDMILIFVTALPEYVYEAFDVNAFHYLVKPFEDKKLWEILDKALQQINRQTQTLVLQQEAQTGHPADADHGKNNAKTNKQIQPLAILVKQGSLSTKVLLTDIIYAEVFNRKIMLHTTNGGIEYYGKLTDLCEQAGANFYRTHRAYLVNLKYVEKYTATTIWVEKDTVPVSKKQFAGFVRQYMQYISRTNGKGADK